ncbi:MAG: 5'/3'-nucleotidase SurE [Puniceicoccaceae bacterium]|nr:MAG: 5'/3'-nucleotidase SurE [Puniceicoccaceae bacterium]
MALPTILVTNDDGIDSPFLAALLDALATEARLFIAAPAAEQSWIGKAMSRHREVAVTPREGFPGPAWAIDGTPSDCVNIALGHLLPARPDLVISGINLGQNAGLPFILASGTIAGAIEAVLHGLPAVAVSHCVESHEFETVKATPGDLPDDLRESLAHAARHTVRFVRALSGIPNPGPFAVHNFNFPRRTRPDTPVHRTVPGPLRTGSLFAPAENARYGFSFSPGEELATNGVFTDIACLRQGCISHSILDYARLGMPA